MAYNKIFGVRMVYMYQDNWFDRYFFEVSYHGEEKSCLDSFLEYISKAENIGCLGVDEKEILDDIKKPDEIKVVEQLGKGYYLVEVLTYG